MSKTTTPKQRRQRRGLPDRPPVDPAISAARKAAANARWRKAAADAVPAAARDDRQYVDHLHRKLLATRSKGADLLADAQPEIVRIVLGIARDEGANGAVRLRACELAWQWAGVAVETYRPTLHERDVSDLTAAELTEMSNELHRMISEKRAATHFVNAEAVEIVEDR